VTSCASMVFFPYVANPDVIIFTHLMGNSSVAFEKAFKHVMNPQAPLGACAHTEGRGIGTTWPEASEIRRYQRDLVFPRNGPPIQPINLETIMCPRESHVWGNVEFGAGHDGLGLAFPASGKTQSGKPSFIGGFDHKRAPGSGVGENNGFKNDDGTAYKLMHDFINGAFGTHDDRRGRYAKNAGREIEPAQLADFKTMVSGIADYSLTNTVLEEAKPQDTMFRLHELGSTLYDKMDQEAKAFKDTPCTFFYQKAESEIHSR